MNTRELLQFYSQKEKVKQLLAHVRDSGNHALLNGIAGSFKAFVPAILYAELGKTIVVLCTEDEEAQYVFQDVSNLLGPSHCALLPSSFRKPFDIATPDNNAIQQRSEFILMLQRSSEPRVLVAKADAIAEKVIDPESLKQNQFQIQVGEVLDLEFMMEVLNTYEFSREDFVYEPGHYSIRGGIIDVFSFAHDLPLRIELDGRNIESIRTFDPVTQLSITELKFSSIVPNIQDDAIAGNRVSLFNYLPKDVCFVANRLSETLQVIETGVDKPELTEIFLTSEEIKTRLSKLSGVEFGNRPHFRQRIEINFDQSPQKTFGKNFKLLIEHLDEHRKLGYDQHIFSETSKQIERLETIFTDLNAPQQFTPVYLGLSEGFIDKENHLALYTEHQIFGRHYQYRNKQRFSKNQALTLRELGNLKPGDFIVHVDHGVGRFEGLQKIEMGGRIQEAVRISYRNEDLLYVNIGSLHKISKYTGKEGFVPKINKLGTETWSNLKKKTKKQVKDIARDLIKLYAKRKASSGYRFAPDTYMQVELEASFLYEDTPDQSKATEDVKTDMMSAHPMDRLVCGDVGFGKTEIAVRAAFKAVGDSKQVAVLVPTTILAQQHYHTFKDRLEGFPCNVDYINRFRTAKQQTQSLKDLAEGKTDILIGTHKLLSSKVKFKDLGLLIIDEEQKFGVGAKEKLKELRANVDTLTLTATPIPRTLHFSLMGARDLSIINTPPPNRQPIHTELHSFDPEVFKKAINYELQRGGQVFVVHNRIKDIHDLASMITDVCPAARVVVGHGQMAGDELENVMLRFIEGEYDVLVSTTIIESGLDIPNANTILVNNAQFFGLSDLHQMRGRVGRSNKKAFCYLIAPPMYTLTDDAKRRLHAIEEFSDLGSGFNVAMRDLDIRGAGNLLGGEQSGFISEIGFDMYHKILDEAVQELREEEFKDVFDEEVEATTDCQVETDLDIMIPDSYVANIAERLNLYTELAKIDKEEGLIQFRDSLKDRFGNLPPQVMDLLQSMRLKYVGNELGLQKIRIKGGKILGYFPDENDQRYYQSARFGKIMASITAHSAEFSLKQKANQLLVVSNNTYDRIGEFHQLMRKLQEG
ncbi:MAG: transcription-repair coupling factor [Flavobacteriales bacterium]|nr:transcription-repair coupling factor [Bacteroidota bacterium]MCB9240748.1 transcription-repair coupling factor [Flavobacteriales bacterium]